MKKIENKALLIVDLQNDFLEGGKLGVNGSYDIIDGINTIMDDYKYIYASCDFHPLNHCSFNGYGGKWSPHCIANTKGAEITNKLNIHKINDIFYKGIYDNMESYSAFFIGKNKINFILTKLMHNLIQFGIKEVDICGLALDFCVKETAIDAVTMGFKANIIWDLTKNIFKVDKNHFKDLNINII